MAGLDEEVEVFWCGKRKYEEEVLEAVWEKEGWGGRDNNGWEIREIVYQIQGNWEQIDFWFTWNNFNYNSACVGHVGIECYTHICN